MDAKAFSPALLVGMSIFPQVVVLLARVLSLEVVVVVG